jgi:hypothetical protein
MVIPRARLLPESFLLGVITIPRAHGLPGVKLLEASTFLEAFLPGNLLTSIPAWRKTLHAGKFNRYIDFKYHKI